MSEDSTTGIGCSGLRKDRRRFPRVVEYDLSSGTRAAYVREFRLPASQGAADHGEASPCSATATG